MLEPEPEEAAEIFGARVDGARRFAHNLEVHGEERGLIGPLELPRLWNRHILNSAIVGPVLSGGVVGDIGSGAGLPGIPLAIMRPDVEFVLIEPMERRVLWLQEQVEDLELSNVSVVRGRAEEVDLRGRFDQVTARAVSALRKLLRLTAPLLRDGGELVLLKGRSAQDEIEAAQKELRRYKVTNARVEVLGDGVIPEPTRVIRGTVER